MDPEYLATQFRDNLKLFPSHTVFRFHQGNTYSSKNPTLCSSAPVADRIGEAVFRAEFQIHTSSIRFAALQKYTNDHLHPSVCFHKSQGQGPLNQVPTVINPVY